MGALSRLTSKTNITYLYKSPAYSMKRHFVCKHVENKSIYSARERTLRKIGWKEAFTMILNHVICVCRYDVNLPSNFHRVILQIIYRFTVSNKTVLTLFQTITHNNTLKMSNFIRQNENLDRHRIGALMVEKENAIIHRYSYMRECISRCQTNVTCPLVSCNGTGLCD